MAIARAIADARNSTPESTDRLSRKGGDRGILQADYPSDENSSESDYEPNAPDQKDDGDSDCTLLCSGFVEVI
jgi:hypothetical protein